MKKGGKKEKKDGGQRKKKSNVPEMTWKEALLAYDISLKEKTMEDIQYELKQTKEQNARFKARNKQLKEDQNNAVTQLLKANKDYEKSLNSKTVFSKEDVVKQMHENWETKKDNDRKLAELEKQLVEKDLEIEACKTEVTHWKEYRDRGQHEHEKTIRLLGQEIVDMEVSFTEISTHLQATIVRAKEEIEKSTADILDRQKYIATEKAIAKMDKYSRREVIDNDWLTRETQIHRQETAELFKVVEKLEEENLKILSELFECQVEDLHISRNFFMTQFADNENLAKSTVLEIDLDRMVQTPGYNSLVPCVRHTIGSQVELTRPKSAIQQAVEDKLFLLEQLHAPVDELITAQTDEFADTEEEQEQEQEQDFDGMNGPEGSDDGDPFLEFHHFDDDDFDDYLQLGPLELKLLNVSGQQMSIYKPPTPPEELMRAKEVRPDTWPVTYTMLRNALHQTPRDTAVLFLPTPQDSVTKPAPAHVPSLSKPSMQTSTNLLNPASPDALKSTSREGSLLPNASPRGSVSIPKSASREGSLLPNASPRGSVSIPKSTSREGSLLPHASPRGSINVPKSTSREGSLLPNASPRGSVNVPKSGKPTSREASLVPNTPSQEGTSNVSSNKAVAVHN